MDVGERERVSAEAELRKNTMMAHLLDALDAGEDIQHYGRLVFAMVARHFMDEEELVGYLRKNPGFSEEQARALWLQVQGRDYSPPRRERILEWQSHQEFPICPNPNDPDACNVYRDLTFPDGVYEHITEYYEQKVESAAERRLAEILGRPAAPGPPETGDRSRPA
jgi:DNA primase large subunit